MPSCVIGALTIVRLNVSLDFLTARVLAGRAMRVLEALLSDDLAGQGKQEETRERRRKHHRSHRVTIAQ